MATSPREIRRRIKSVKNIGQITKAMELVAAAKMRKSQNQATASRPYSVMTSELLRNLLKKNAEFNNRLINRVMVDGARRAASTKTLAILITSDRGLAGAFNSNVINQALAVVKREGSEKLDFIAIGKKGADVLRRRGQNIVAVFGAKDRNITSADARPIAKIAVQDFLAYKYNKVFIIYTDFVSTLVQKPNITQMLPLTKEEAEDSKVFDEILIEPGVEQVLDRLVERTIEFAVYQTLVESAASEHSARMVAMRNANEAAGELIDDLTLSYNQARQAGITRELSEISAAKLAME